MGFWIPAFAGMTTRCEPRRGLLYRLDDLLITGAAAEIAADRFAYLGFGGLRHRVQQRLSRDQHARRAIAALERVRVAEAVLKHAWAAVRFRETFHRGHAMTVGLHGEHEARAHRLAVEKHRARAADAVLAADVRAGQAK